MFARNLIVVVFVLAGFFLGTVVGFLLMAWIVAKSATDAMAALYAGLVIGAPVGGIIFAVLGGLLAVIVSRQVQDSSKAKDVARPCVSCGRDISTPFCPYCGRVPGDQR